jgi:excisionase family DNA binding protein
MTININYLMHLFSKNKSQRKTPNIYFVAKNLGVSRTTIYKWIEKGTVPKTSKKRVERQLNKQLNSIYTFLKQHELQCFLENVIQANEKTKTKYE